MFLCGEWECAKMRRGLWVSTWGQEFMVPSSGSAGFRVIGPMADASRP